MSRPSFEQICMGIAEAIAQRSTCRRTNSAGDPMKVGCVITSMDFRKILSWGYNGNAAGLPNHCDSTEPGSCGCLHGESNAIINCDEPRATQKRVFVTHLPCVACAKMMINLGNVVRVYYRNEYRIRDSLELLRLVGIDVLHMPAESQNVLAP